MGWWVEGLTKGHRAAIAARLGELPPEERRRLLVDARRAANRDLWTYTPLMLSTIAGAAAVGFVAIRAAVPEFIRSSPVSTPAELGVVAVITGPAGVVWSILTQERLFRRHLAAAFPTLCPACGYDCRATAEKGGALLPRCPECGRERPGAASPPA